MGESSGLKSWGWEIPVFEPRRTSSATAEENHKNSSDNDDEDDENRIARATARSLHVPVNSIMARRLSLPTHLGNACLPFDEQKKQQQQQDLYNRLLKLKEALVSTRNDFLEIRQEASDLQEYSNVKLSRVTRYLGVLADKTRKLDRIAADYELRLAVLRKEKAVHYNELIASKGNIRVFVRACPTDETATQLSFPDECTVLINKAGEKTTSIAEFRFDQVYEPHVSQGEFFQDIQPLVQSAIDGYNVSLFACGARGSGKSYTLEGPSHDRGVYFRAFEELFDLANGESTPSSKFKFYISMFELCNEQVEDLLVNVAAGGEPAPDKVQIDSSLELLQLPVENPMDFARVFKAGLQNQHMTGLKTKNMSSPCLAVIVHVHYSNTSTGIKQYSKLSLVDVPGTEPQMTSEGISSTFASLVEVASALVSRKEHVPYEKSKLARILSHSLGGDSKTLIILNINPSDANIGETKSWLKMARFCYDSSRSLQNKIYEEQNKELKLELDKIKRSLKESEEQCALLFKELQKSWKVASTLEHGVGVRFKVPAAADDSLDKSKFEKDQIAQLKTQVAQFAKYDRDQKAELANRASKILALEDKVQELSQQLGSKQPVRSPPDSNGVAPSAAVAEELAKRDELIERLHEENEQLFKRLTERGTFSPKARQSEPPPVDNLDLNSVRTPAPKQRTSSPHKKLAEQTYALQKANSKTTPAGEYLTAALTDFDPEHYQGSAAVSDAANKLLMLVLAAVIKAGASREHDMLEEIRGAVFSFIRKLEPRKLMDTMLVSRVRILYVRSLLARSPELQGFKVPTVDRFLEKGGSKTSRASSTGSSPTRSPASSQIQSGMMTTRKDPLDEHISAFKVTLKQEKASKLSSIVLKLRGIDQETWRQHLTGAKLREMNEEARNFAVGNKKLAALFVHIPAGELQRQIRSWLAENFDFLSLTYSGDNNTASGGGMGQLELLSTAIMDGWMAGLGIPIRPTTDALGQLLSDYTKHVYMSQLQNLKDVAATLATEEADDLPQVTKIRSALETIEHKRRKILQQMRNDPALLTKEEGGSPLRCPSTASEEARIASLISLEDICNQAEEIRKEAPQKATFASKKKFMLSRLESLTEQTSALLSIDHPCAHKFIKAARQAIEATSTDPQYLHSRTRNRRSSSEDAAGAAGGELSSSSDENPNLNPAQAASEVVQWSVLQFNNGSDTPFIIKCGATSAMQLVIKAQAKADDTSSQINSNREVVAIVPSPPALSGLSLEEIKQVLQPLPEAFRQLAMARTADGTRARYSRLYKTLAVRVPALRSSVSDVEEATITTSTTTPLARNPARKRTGPGSLHARRSSDSDHFLSDY